jgi:hypothetical protein
MINKTGGQATSPQDFARASVRCFINFVPATEFKAKVAMEALFEQKTLAEI